MKPRLLDLFCGAGGAAMGYHRAGFEVVGVDINPQPHYPFPFIQADALIFLQQFVDGHGSFDAIHASPPCQAFTRAGHLRLAQNAERSSEGYELGATRRLLRESGLPYVIENVEGAPLIDPVLLCGSAFGLGVRRHRLFESNLFFLSGGDCRHRQQGRPVGVYHRMKDSIPNGGTTARSIEEARAAMDIDWMDWDELKQAIPPAYTEWIGRQLIAALENVA